MSELPDIVYKFVSPEAARLMLSNLTVRYTPLPELNDPAEAPLFGGDETLEQFGRLMISQDRRITQEEQVHRARFFTSRHCLDTASVLCRRWGILCLAGADSLTYSPMWSHYADGHKGLAIGILTASQAIQGSRGLRPVDYSGTVKNGTERIMSKLPCWDRECEYRAWKLLPPPNDSREEPSVEQQFEKFNPVDINTIVLGSRSDQATWEFVRHWLEKYGREEVILRYCAHAPSGSLEIVSIPSEAVMAFFDASTSLRKSLIDEDNAEWEALWQKLEGTFRGKDDMR